MAEQDDHLRRAVDVLEDGKAFYAQAREDGGDVALGQLCTRMIEERDIAIRRLLPLFAEPSAADAALAEEGTWAGTVDRAYTEARGFVGGGRHAFVDGLIDYERRLAETVAEVLETMPEGQARQALEAVRAEVVRTEETLAALRQIEERE